MKRITPISVLCLVACGQDPGFDPSPGAAETARLRGRAFGLEPLAHERVQVVRMEDGVATEIVAETQTDGLGDFELEVPITGSVHRVDVGVSVSVPSVSVLVVALSPGAVHAADANVFTRFAATLAVHRMRSRARPAELALREAVELIDDHFAGVAHHRTQPMIPFANATPSGLSGWLMMGLVEQARARGVRLPELVDAYTHDLAHDGIFDGIGRNGVMLMGSSNLSGASLRGDYADALQRVLANVLVDPDAFSPFIHRIRMNDSEIFPRGLIIVPERADAGDSAPDAQVQRDVDAPVLELALLDVDGQPIAAGSSVRGVRGLRVRAEDPSGLRSTRIELSPADGPSVELDAQTVDTQLIPDGPFRLSLEAVDEMGNLGRVEVDYAADNTAPTVQLVHPAVIGASPATVRVLSSDGEGVSRVVLAANGRVVSALLSPGAEATASIGISCPGATTLEATAYDHAGNTAHVETAIACEDRGPIVQLHSASWRQEANLNATYRVDGRTIDYDTAQPVFASFDDASTDELEIERYWPRLHESLVGRSDLPRVRFELIDRAGGGLQVQVRHETAAGPGAWFSPETVADSLFEVPIGYEQLGATLLEQHAAPQAIVIRATDVFGITNERVVRFRLALRSPPLWVGACSLVASAMDPSLVISRLRSATPSEVGSLGVHYAAGVPSGSPIIPPRVSVSASSAGGRVELDESSTVRFDGNFANRSASGGPSYLSCGWVSAGVGSVYERYRCLGVSGVGTWTWLQNPSTGASRTAALPAPETTQTFAAPLNDPIPQPLELAFYDGTQTIAPAVSGRFELDADRDLEAYVSIRPTPVRIENQVWSWPTQPSLLASGLTPAIGLGPSYWLPTTGSEIGAHGRNLTCSPAERLGLAFGGPNTNPSCTWQERAVQTLPRLSRVVVRAPVPALSASLPALNLPVPVQVSNDCGSEWRYELDLGLL